MGLFCGQFNFFIERNFLGFFFNMFFKIFIIPPINYMIYVKFFKINMNSLKVYNFYQMLRFILKNDHNFKSC